MSFAFCCLCSSSSSPSHQIALVFGAWLTISGSFKADGSVAPQNRTGIHYTYPVLSWTIPSQFSLKPTIFRYFHPFLLSLFKIKSSVWLLHCLLFSSVTESYKYRACLRNAMVPFNGLVALQTEPSMPKGSFQAWLRGSFSLAIFLDLQPLLLPLLPSRNSYL